MGSLCCYQRWLFVICTFYLISTLNSYSSFNHNRLKFSNGIKRKTNHFCDNFKPTSPYEEIHSFPSLKKYALFFGFVYPILSKPSIVHSATKIKEPLVQGVLDVKSYVDELPQELTIFIEVFNSTSTIPLAGAKFYAKDALLPIRFQLFEENLLIKKKQWDSLIDFDQNIKVKVCKSNNYQDCMSDQILYSGEATSKVVTIGNAETGIRRIRISPLVQLESLKKLQQS